MPFKASAPGSLMLLGEYAVLYGKPSLVCALNKRITVTLTPRSDDKIEIHSASHGHYSTTLEALKIEKPFQFVLGALQQYQSRLRRGCDIEIESEFSDQVGLGSSAAVTVANLAALSASQTMKMTPTDIIRQGRQVVKAVQGVGSGADIAASVMGGMVGYQTQPFAVEKFSVTHPLSVVYVGFKTPTVEAIKQVQASFAAHSSLLRALTNGIGQCAVEGLQLVRKEEWSKLGEIMNVQQGLMAALGVSTPLLNDIVEHIRYQPGILGAKISGSGLGDCMVGLGELPKDSNLANDYSGVQPIPVEMTLQGVHCEKF